MAFNPGIEQDEEDKNATQAGGTDQLGGSSGVITGATAAEGAAQKGKGSGFVNIGSYLDANKEDIPGQTNQAIGKVQEKYDTATGSVKASQDAFNTTADQNRGAYVQGAANADDARKAIADNLRSDNEIDENDRNTWASYANSEYKGPKELDNTFQPEATEAKDWSNTLTDTNGYYPMMSKMFGQNRSDYNTGMQRLDGSLIASDKDSRQKFNDFNATASAGLDSTVEGARSASAAKVGQYQTEADYTKQAARDALEKDVLPEYMTGLTGQVKTTNDQRQAEIDAWKAGAGPTTESFNMAQEQSVSQDPSYQQAIDRINDRYGLDVSRGISKSAAAKVRDTDLAAIQSIMYAPRSENEVRFSAPEKSAYTEYGPKVGMGSLDPASMAKLEALFGMSANGDLRNQLESGAGSTLGMTDIYTNGSGPAVKFDQAGWDQAYNAAKQAEIRNVRGWESEIKATAMQRQQQWLDNYMNHGGATAYSR
jgi:uncharacterized protein YjbJ (UPF0337 family)